jgi:hypothetical protein
MLGSKDGIITTTIEEQVGLDCAKKLFAICGDNATNNNTFCDHFHCDIDRYLDTPALHWNPQDKSNWDPDWVLKWWDANAFQYPLMAAAARALLAISGSEVDVERLFSGGRDLLGIRRYALKGETMRILTLLKAYFERIQAKDSLKYTAQLREVRDHFIIS